MNGELERLECANCLQEVDIDADFPCQCHGEHFHSMFCQIAWHKREGEREGLPPRERLNNLIYRARAALSYENDAKDRALELFILTAFELGGLDTLQGEISRAERKIDERKAEGWRPIEEGKNLPDAPPR